MKTLNVGLIGYKFMGKAHSNAYARLPMFFDLSVGLNRKAICGRDGEWLKRAADMAGRTARPTGKLVSRPDIDMVDITSSNTHKEIAIAAAAEGKHVSAQSRWRSISPTPAR